MGFNVDYAMGFFFSFYCNVAHVVRVGIYDFYVTLSAILILK